MSIRNDLTLEDAKAIALRAVKAAIVRNIGTGDGINHRNNRQKWIPTFDKGTKKIYHFALVI